VRTLSAEGRLSGYILIGLPLGVLAFLAIIRRSYVELLWTTGLGLVMLFLMGALMVLGWFWMRAIVRIRP
jgi:tight adherence protein B